MTIQRASLMMPSDRLDDWPGDLRGDAAAELLSAWCSLWHPTVVHAIRGLPGWHSATDPPEPTALENELVVIPPYSGERLPFDWRERINTSVPRNPPTVLSKASRQETVREILAVLAPAGSAASREIADDFLALGFAHLQVELLTRAMRYTSVLDADAFRGAVVEAADAAEQGDDLAARDRLTAAFDQLFDARNHFYAVDFYLVDVTLLATTTLGAALRDKLNRGTPTNFLATGEVLETLAAENADVLGALREAVLEKRCVMLGGPLHGAELSCRSPEGMLSELTRRRALHERLLHAPPTVYGQFGAGLSPLLPELLSGLGYRGALLATFDGSFCERPQQPKARWGKRGGPELEVMSGVPLDIAEPSTWLAFGERISDTLSRDHVATLLLAGWPGQSSEYYDDLRRIAEYSPVLGKFVTLDDYFQATAESEYWARFSPQLYANRGSHEVASEPISARVAAYRSDLADSIQSLVGNFKSVVVGACGGRQAELGEGGPTVLNPWNFTALRFGDFDPLAFSEQGGKQEAGRVLSVVPPCGFARIDDQSEALPVELACGRVLRNEFLEVVISEQTGGIQSVRTHRDRGTRASQRLIMHDARLPSSPVDSKGESPVPSTRMRADRIDVSRSDAVAGEITAQGTLTDAEGRPLARFVQAARIVRGLPLVILDVQLTAEFSPQGGAWTSYYASRLTWREEAVDVRCGVNWTSRPTTRRRIETPEWIEVTDATGSIACFACGLPYHRLSGPTWLDSIILTAGESGTRRQLAVGLNCTYPTQTALAVLSAGIPAAIEKGGPRGKGWLLHVSARNVLLTHMETLGAAGGMQLRLLETEGREGLLSITAYRPFKSARRTDFAGEFVEVLSVNEGAVRMEIGPYRWIQVEAEW